MNAKRLTPRHIIIKMIKVKETILKEAMKKKKKDLHRKEIL